MSSNSITPFVGTSSYSQALQAALNRALAIAALPIQQLSANKAQTDAQSNELDQISSLLSTLQNALAAIPSSSGNGALAATVGNSSIVQATLNGPSLAGSYVIQVLDPGSFSSGLSNSNGAQVSDPTTQSISSSNTFTLTVGGSPFTFQTSANTLTSLADAINSSGAPVQATIINLGSPSAPDYRLAVQATNLGNVSLQLNDGTNDLLDTTTTGTNGSYTVNGQPPSGISTTTRTVTVAPGLNVTLEAAGTTTVTVAGSTTAISNALTSFVNAYNAVIGELAKNHGKSGGPLTGDSSINNIQDALRQIINYNGAVNSIGGLTDLGIEFTQQGTLTLDSSKLSNLSQSQISDATKFLGDPLSGGFLKVATDTLNSLTDPVSGLVAGEQQSLQAQSQREAQAINDAQDRLLHLQTSLQAQMAAADALIASLQQQTQFIDGLFQIPTLKSNGTFSNGQ